MDVYLFVLIAALFFSMQFIFSKTYQKNAGGTILSNFWMSAFYAIWLILIFFTASGFSLHCTASTWLFSALNALCSLFCTGATIMAYGLGSMSTVTLYLLVGGQAVPFLYGILAGARPSLLCYAGFAVMLISFLPGILLAPKAAPGDSVAKESAPVPQEKPGRAGSGSRRLLFHLLCLVIFFANGLISVLTTLKAQKDPGTPNAVFLTTNGICLLLLAGILILLFTVSEKKKHGGTARALFLGSVHKKTTWPGALIAFITVGLYTGLNGLGNIFSLRAAGTGMSPDIQHPILNAAIIVITPFIARIVFKEKQRAAEILGVVLAATGILLFLLDYLLA